jgi:hypothetical protein
MSLITSPVRNATRNRSLALVEVREPIACHCCSIGLEDGDMYVQCVYCGAAYCAGAGGDCIMVCECDRRAT